MEGGKEKYGTCGSVPEAIASSGIAVLPSFKIGVTSTGSHRIGVYHYPCPQLQPLQPPQHTRTTYSPPLNQLDNSRNPYLSSLKNALHTLTDLWPNSIPRNQRHSIHSLPSLSIPKTTHKNLQETYIFILFPEESSFDLFWRRIRIASHLHRNRQLLGNSERKRHAWDMSDEGLTEHSQSCAGNSDWTRDVVIALEAWMREADDDGRGLISCLGKI